MTIEGTRLRVLSLTVARDQTNPIHSSRFNFGKKEALAWISGLNEIVPGSKPVGLSNIRLGFRRRTISTFTVSRRALISNLLNKMQTKCIKLQQSKICYNTAYLWRLGRQLQIGLMIGFSLSYPVNFNALISLPS